MPKEHRSDPGETLVNAARAYIETHSTEKFSLQALSDALFVNGSYLLRVFKHRTGITLLSYHNAVRCENAKALLSQPDRSISEIGEAVGFLLRPLLPRI